MKYWSFRRLLGKKQRSEKGQAIIEMIFSIIMFAFMVAGITMLSSYLYVQHAMITAAREGARIAALNSELGDVGSEAVGIAAVQDYVIEMVGNTSGIALEEGNITVTPPAAGDPVGERSVLVEVDFEVNNPFPMVGPGTFTVHSEATMHYEE